MKTTNDTPMPGNQYIETTILMSVYGYGHSSRVKEYKGTIDGLRKELASLQSDHNRMDLRVGWIAVPGNGGVEYKALESRSDCMVSYFAIIDWP